MPWLLMVLFLVPSDPSKLTIPPPTDYSTTTLSAYIKSKHVAGLWETLKCESAFQWDAYGDASTSVGIAQIHLSAHKEVTEEQALDPYFSIDWAIKQFKAGKQSMWSCWKS